MNESTLAFAVVLVAFLVVAAAIVLGFSALAAGIHVPSIGSIR